MSVPAMVVASASLMLLLGLRWLLLGLWWFYTLYEYEYSESWINPESAMVSASLFLLYEYDESGSNESAMVSASSLLSYAYDNDPDSSLSISEYEYEECESRYDPASSMSVSTVISGVDIRTDCAIRSETSPEEIFKKGFSCVVARAKRKFALKICLQQAYASYAHCVRVSMKKSPRLYIFCANSSQHRKIFLSHISHSRETRLTALNPRGVREING